MSNDLFDLDDEQAEDDFSSFETAPEVGDLKILNDMIKRAAEVQAGIKKLETRTEEGKALFKSIMEVELPQKMAACGFQVGDSVAYGGIKVELKSDTYANVPSISAINDERDENKREVLIARREAGLSILEEKAPTLIKRKFDISIDKDRLDQVECVKNLLTEMEDPPDWCEGKTVHPATLGKWIKEVEASGKAFTEEEDWAFGRFKRKIAKIIK